MEVNTFGEMDPPSSPHRLNLLYEADQPGSDQRQTEFEDDSAPESDNSGRFPPRRIIDAITGHALLTSALALLLVVVALGSLRLWIYLQSYESTDDAQVEAHISPISSRINGTVIGVYVEDNQRVKAGELLIQLDPHDYQIAVERAQGQLTQAEADANSARQEYVSALAKIHQAQAHDYQARRDQERYSALLRQRVVSQASYDQYDATARVDDADVRAAEADAASAQRSIASHDAQVETARAALDQALADLSYTRIVAPTVGIIGKRSAELGQRVEPGESLMALTETDERWVTANFKETQLARMRHGQPVTIHIDALGRDFRGHVQSMPGAAGSLYDLLPPENATGNYVKVVQRLPVRIVFDPGQDLSRLRPGMSVEPTVWLS